MYCLESTRTCGTGPRRVRSDVLGFFGETDSADTGATGCPRLDLDHNLGAISAAQLLRCSNRFIGRVRGASTRNFESVSGENFFALIFVQSGPGWQPFGRKHPTVNVFWGASPRRPHCGALLQTCSRVQEDHGAASEPSSVRRSAKRCTRGACAPRKDSSRAGHCLRAERPLSSFLSAPDHHELTGLLRD